MVGVVVSVCDVVVDIDDDVVGTVVVLEVDDDVGGAVVVLDVVGWSEATNSSTNASTLASANATSPIAAHPPLASSFRQRSSKRREARARHSGSTVPSLRA